MKPKILIWDLEITPILGYSYGMWETNVLHIVEDWYVYAWSAKWHGEKKIYYKGINEYPTFKKDKTNDRGLIADLRPLLEQADVLVAHNGDKFDLKKIKTRFAKWGFDPLVPRTTIDPLKVLKREFSLSSNSLDYACRFFGLERKKPSDQKDWLLRMKEGDEQVWKKIKSYSIQDTIILDQLYTKLIPHIPNHPNISGTAKICKNPDCLSAEFRKNGFRYRASGKIQQYQCLKCKTFKDGERVKV